MNEYRNNFDSIRLFPAATLAGKIFSLPQRPNMTQISDEKGFCSAASKSFPAVRERQGKKGG
jgi:hypothetical protein